MKKYIKAVVIIALTTVLLFLSLWTMAGSATTYEKVVVEVEKKDVLSYEQRAWLGALQWCESRGKPQALNPNDRDHTPSYGILQFKISTFYNYGKLYGINTSKGYKDPEAQIKIVEQMIIKGGVKWEQQFPDCVKKLGRPPKLLTPSVDKK